MLRGASVHAPVKLHVCAMVATYCVGATTHQPLAAIENLTPVKTVPDELKQLPSKLPKIRTFDASSRYES